MKEHINVSIAGVAFQLETDGYALLKDYLVRIEMQYRNNPDGREILADIEARICELILNVQPNSIPVTCQLIREIIQQLGIPEDPANPAQPITDNLSESLPKRLYRNPEGAKLGGVCSGLGTYFNAEPVLFRLMFVAPLPLMPLCGILGADFLAGFFGTLVGVFLILYFLLWFAIPQAKTPRQKLEMQGNKITAEAIRQHLESDISPLPNDKKKRNASALADLIYICGQVITFLIRFIVGVVAFAFLGAAVAVIVGLFIVLIAPSSFSTLVDTSWLSGYVVFIVLFASLATLTLGFMGYILLLLLLNKKFPKRTAFIAIGVWLILLIGLIIWGTRNIHNVQAYKDYQQIMKSKSPTEQIKSSDDTYEVERIIIGDTIILDTIYKEYFSK